MSNSSIAGNLFTEELKRRLNGFLANASEEDLIKAFHEANYELYSKVDVPPEYVQLT